jgi:Ca-activated chloride channel family protein
MVQVSVRALRLFRLYGDPVTGGTSTADPAEVEPGDYVDETAPDGGSKYYLVDLPKGGAVSASAVLRPESGETVDTLRVELMTPDGDSCADDLAQRVNVLGLSSIVGTAAHYDSHAEGLNSEVCRAADQLLVHVTFEGPTSPFGLRVRSYPKVRDAGSLPEPTDSDQRDTWEQPVRLTGTGTPVVGGGTFEDAPELEPGTTYSDTLRPREQLIYKVTVPWGTAPRMTARLETDATAREAQGALGVNVRAGAFNPLGARMNESFNGDTGVNGSGFYNGEKPLTLTAAQPPVHYRNIESSDGQLRRSSIAGTYWFTLEMGGDSDRTDERFQAPVRLAVELGGEEAGEPDYAGAVEGSPSPTAAASPNERTEAGAAERSSTDDGGGIPWLPLGLAAAVLVVLAALLGGFVLGRRGRTRA